jgi:siroheme synthase-like protein
MAFYPVMLELGGKKCLVVGGGRVALRKVIGLLRAGASVTAVSPRFIARFRRVAPRITMIVRPFSARDISSSLSLVIGATDSPEVNATIYRKASERGVLCSVVDSPHLSSFIAPAIVRRGCVTVAISTGGACPRLSRYMKTRAAAAFDPGVSRLAAYLAEVRKKVRKLCGDGRARNAFWEAVFETDPMAYIHARGWPHFRKRTERLVEKFTQGRKPHEK